MKFLCQTAIVFCGILPSLGAVQAQNAGAMPPAETAPIDATAKPSAPRFKLTEDNLQALAMMGAFYNSLRRTASYRGHFTMTKTVVKDGKTIRKKVADWRSIWLGDGDGDFSKRAVEGKFTTIEGEGATTVEVLRAVDDGKMRRSFNPAKNVWSEKDQPFGEPDGAMVFSKLAWTMVLVSFNMGDEFEISKQISNVEPEQVVITNQSKSFVFAFDAASGNLRLWRISSTDKQTGDGETTEVRWSELELNKTLAPEVFQWTPPAGARQVPSAENERKFEF